MSKNHIPLILLLASSSVLANTWLDQALKLQRDIDINAPLTEATFLGTHNSYNSKAYQMFPVRYVDPNQTLSIPDQLNAGVRSIELDAHWTLNNRFGKEILLCHGQHNHIGCSAFDRPIAEALLEIRDWLKAHPNELILLYIERHLDGHEFKLAELLDAYLGSYIYKPKHDPNEICTSLSSEISKADVIKAGKQVIVVSQQCENENIAWNKMVFAGAGKVTTKPYTFLDFTITHFKPSPDCSRSNLFYPDPDHSSLWRIYEDRTLFGKVIHSEKPLTELDMKELTRCELNWLALDMLTFNDSRLQANIWSWAPNYPQADRGNCAYFSNGVGIMNTTCDTNLPGFVCQEDPTRVFRVIFKNGAWKDGYSICQSLGGNWKFATPINGVQMEAVRQFLKDDKNKSKNLWLNYAINSSEQWQANLG